MKYSYFSNFPLSLRYGILFAVSALLTTLANAQPFVSDDFNSGTIDANTWTFVDPQGGSSATANADSVQISVTGGSAHDLWTSYDSPRLLQSINDTDFTIEAKFLSEPTQRYQIQGIVIEEDANNILRFDLYSDGNKLRAFSASITSGSPTAMISQVVSKGEATYYLRVQRQGAQWTFSISFDGSSFSVLGSFTRSISVTQAGVFAGNATGSSSPAFVGIVDYAYNTDSPPVGGSTASLSLATSGNGNVSANPSQSTYTVGESIQITATPDADWTFTSWSGDASGSDNPLSYTVAEANSITALFSPLANSPPTISAIADQITAEDLVAGPIAFTIDDPESGAAGLILSATSSNQGLLANGNITFGGSGASRTINASPELNQSGSTTVSITVSDGSLSATEDFLLTFDPVNDAPAISSINNQSVDEDESTNAIAFTINDVETVASSLLLSAASSNQSLLPNANIVLGGSGTNRTVTAAPLTGQTGVATITVSVDDGNLVTTEEFTLSVAQSAGLFTSDDFSSGSIDGNLWTFTDPLGGSSATVDTDSLLISVPGGTAHDIWTTNDAPRLLQEVEDSDFIIDAKFESEPSEKYQIQGILIEQDSDNLLRFDLYSDGSKLRAFSASIASGSPTAMISQVISSGQDSYYLRVERTANQWTYSYSIDGTAFTVAGSFSRALTVANAGVFAGNATGSNSPAFIADIDYAFNTASPIIPEDGVGGGPTGSVNVTISGNGSVVIDPSLATYAIGQSAQITATPDADWTFSGWSGDAAGSDNPLSFTVTGANEITALFAPLANTAPTISVFSDQTTDEDLTAGPFAFTIGDAESGAAALVLSATSSNQSLLADANITFNGSDTSRTASATPEADQFGSATVTVTVDDGELSSTESFLLTFNPINDAPSISTINDQSVEEGQSTDALAFTVGDIETAATSLVISASSSNQTLVPDANVVLSGSSSARTVTVTPQIGETGISTISVTVDDGTTTTTESFILSVAQPTGPFISDDFSSGVINGNLWTFVDPLGGSTATLDADSLQISVPGGSPHDLWTAYEVPRLMQQVDNTDFTIEAKFESEPTLKYQIQGLVIEEDEDNVLRFDLYSDGSRLRIFSASVASGTPSAEISQIMAKGQGSYYLRVERVSNSWTLSYSFDGFAYTVADTFSKAMVVSQVGVFAGNAAGGSSPAFVADVDFAFNTASPIIPEDGQGGGGAGTLEISTTGNGNVTEDPIQGTYTIGQVVQLTATPDTNWAFIGWSEDASGINNPLSFTVTGTNEVTAIFAPLVNTTPTISSISDQVSDEDLILGPVAFTIGDAETNASALVISATSSNQSLLADGNIAFAGTDASRTLNATPELNQFGSTTISVTVSDGVLSATEDFLYSVNSVDDSPTISAIADQNVGEGESTGAIAFTIGDAETSAANLTVTSSSSNQPLLPDGNIVLGGSGINRTVTVTPQASLSGTAIVTITVEDGVNSTHVDFTLIVAQPAGPFISDDFSTGSLNSSIWTFVDPLGDSSVTSDSDSVQISVLGGSAHDVWTTGIDAPRLMQTIADTDFEIEAKYESVGTLQFQMQGIVIEQDENNFIRFDVYSHNSGTNLFGAYFENGNTTIVFNQSISSGGENYLKLSRTGDQWTFQHSSDGVVWNILGSATKAYVVSRAGVFAGNAAGSSSPAFTADIDYVFNTASPILAEDGIPTGPTGTISVSTIGSGSITPDPSQSAYSIGQVVQLTATPNAGWLFNNWDGDLSGSTNPTSLTISTDHNVSAVFAPVANTNPTISIIADQLTNEDQSISGIAVTLSDAESDEAELTLDGSSTNQALLPDSSIQFSGTGANRTLLLTPEADQSGTSFITIDVTDGFLTNNVSFLLTVNPTNDAPTITSVSNQFTTEGNSVNSIPLTIGDIETLPNNLILVGISSNETLLPNSGIEFTGTGSFRTLSLTPAAGQTGNAVVTLAVDDGDITATTDFTITVNPPAGPFVSDDFSAGSLNTGIWTFVNPLADSSFNVDDDSVQITVAGGSSHDVWASGANAPRLMQAVNNADFEVETRIQSSVTQQYQLQGFLIYQNDTNFIRFDVFSDGITARIFSAAFNDGSVSLKIDIDVATAPVYFLKVSRVGNQWTYSYSYDGTNWLTAGTYSHSFTVNQVGIFAGNAGGSNSPEFTADFDYTFNNTSPIIPEDNGNGTIILTKSGLGSFTLSPEKSVYDPGDVVDITATPESDWAFDGWSGTIVSSSSPLQIVMNGDVTLEGSFSPTNSSAAIDVWYGDTQNFGQIGIPQTAVNILGSIPIWDQTTALTFSVNGGPESPISMGPGDNIRLNDMGDFNIEIPFTDLLEGSNSVTITVTLTNATVYTRTITVNNSINNVWPLPYTVDWSTVTNINDVAQVVDGKWDLTTDGVRSIEPHYDRLINVGDIDWTNYEVIVPLTVHSIHPEIPGNPPLVGVLMRWDGHEGSVQPSTVWWPMGAMGIYGWYTNSVGNRFQIFEDRGIIRHDDTSGMKLDLETRYIFKMRVETIPGQTAGYYSFKAWKESDPEPAAWILEAQATTGLTTGSLLLVSHYTDTTFGNITVTPIPTP